MPANGAGITTFNYSDRTQVLTINASIPLDVVTHTDGNPLVEISDYVASTASWVDLFN